MATIKSYTDLSQSKKLAEILPFESVDMFYKYVLPKFAKINHTPQIGNPINSLKWYNAGYTFRGNKEPITLNEYCVPCWSLAALLNVLPDGTDIVKDKADTENEKYMCTVGIKDDIISTFGNNPIDACVDMILKLKQSNLL